MKRSGLLVALTESTDGAAEPYDRAHPSPNFQNGRFRMPTDVAWDGRDDTRH